MKKPILSLVFATLVLGITGQVQAQSEKNKKSRYYQNNTTQPEEFNIEGFSREPEKREIEKKTPEKEYDVNVRRNQSDSRYYNEKKVELDENGNEINDDKPQRRRRRVESYPTTYGGNRRYDENRNKYDKYYDGPRGQNLVNNEPPPPPPPPPPAPAPVLAPAREEGVNAFTESDKIAKKPRVSRKAPKVSKKQVEEREIGMTPNELEYKTTVVKRRYTNLDVLCDDLDLAKVQRPVFKGICSECSSDVDKIIVDKNMSSLEKNYNLKQCYMLRDKRLRETLDDDQYKKFLRIKDADEYLIITKDLELKDGTNR
jgi:hypothetical protein